MRMQDLTNDVLMRLFNARTPVLFLGKPGVGKTERIEQFARENNLGIVSDMDLTSIDPPDVRGYAIPQKDEDGNPVTRFTMSPILTAVARTGKDRGVLFLDELLQADALVQKAIAPALSARRFGDHYLPDGWVIWAASNRAQDRAGTVKMLGHVTNRVNIVGITADLNGWLRWASANDIAPEYQAFAKARPGIMFDNDPPKDSSKPYATPRSITNACRLHTQGLEVGQKLPLDNVTLELVSGLIGDAAAAELFAFARTADEVPTIDQIVKDPMTARLPSPDRLDAQFMAQSMCLYHANEHNIEPIFQYVTRLNKELQAAAAKELCTKSGVLMNSPTLTKWVTENKALVIATLGN